ncbi:hypothetical protein FA15DRAFT_751704 [Coprinopsis marcescibilis]|uniref:Uncharacterized protein n=1 Tax=Coprinopsis marcescibilis TaxID=230819 RepID=A0A5C3LFN2_COPMA|nr:hypothetical protein FA15DRAFT_751704 [Coprinopsis marcescibilis]
MARATRSTAALQQQPQPQLQRKRKRPSSPSQIHASKQHKPDDYDDIHHPDTPDIFLQEQDAQKILDVLELSDTQGLLDRVFPSANGPDALVSLRTLLKHPAQHPLPTVKAAVNNLRPISSLPRSRPSPAASQQHNFANLALSLIEQASLNAISAPLDVESILELVPEDDNSPSKSPATGLKRRYALVQHLPQGDYWTSLSSDAPSSTLKQLLTGHAELVAILPSSSSTSLDTVPTLGSISSRPLGPTKKIAGQRRVTTGGFLDYGPFASFAPSFDQNGEVVGQRQLAEVIYQKELKKRVAEENRREQREGSGSVTAVGGDVVMNGTTSAPDPAQPSTNLHELEGLLPPEDIEAIKEALGSLELENAVQELLERNQRALQRLEELQWKRFSEGGANFTAVEEGSEEWETATHIMESLAALTSLRPRTSEQDGPSLVPPSSVLRKLHASLALEPSPGWYGNLPGARAVAFHDDSTIKVKPPTATSASVTPAPAATPAASIPPSANTAAYPNYGYTYGTPSQQQPYRPATYAAYKPGQAPAGYYQQYPGQQQSYYNQQNYAGTSNQQPYGATSAQQPQAYAAAYQGWYAQYQQNAAAGAKGAATPAANTASYGSYYNANAAVNGTPGNRTPAVANTVATKSAVGTPQAIGTWPAYQAQSVAPTLPSHLRTSQQAATAYQNQVAGYYQAAAYQAQQAQGQTATPTSPAR